MSDGEPGQMTARPPWPDSKYAFWPRQPTPSSSFLYDIAVEVSGVQDEQGCGLDQVRVGCWSLGSLMVVACPSPTAGCAAYGQFVNVVLVRANDQRASCHPAIDA